MTITLYRNFTFDQFLPKSQGKRCHAFLKGDSFKVFGYSLQEPYFLFDYLDIEYSTSPQNYFEEVQPVAHVLETN